MRRKSGNNLRWSIIGIHVVYRVTLKGVRMEKGCKNRMEAKEEDRK